jgi:hypothetical protein
MASLGALRPYQQSSNRAGLDLAIMLNYLVEIETTLYYLSISSTS